MNESTPHPIEQRLDLHRHDAVSLPATTILERTLNEKSVDAKHRARAEAMARVLNTFLEPRYLNPRIQKMMATMPQEIISGETGENFDHIAARIRERVRRAVHFFVQPYGEWQHSPVMRIAALFDDIAIPENDAQKTQINAAIQQYIDTLIPLAFEQQLQDPPRFVSHDWAHSMRVAEHAIGIATALSPEKKFETSPIIVQMMRRYGISAPEVRLILSHATMCHDCGYPHLNGRSKSMHAIDSAELAACDAFVNTITTFIQSPDAQMDVLKKDLYDAVFYHGADVAQDRFEVRIITNRGNFLTTPKKLKDVIHILKTTRILPNETARIIEKVEYAGAQNTETKKEIQQIVQELCPNAQSQLLDSTPFFTGRKFDLSSKGDELAGVEYQYADSKQTPLLTLVRLADNMDLTSHRLGLVRHHPAYYEIIRRIGREGKDHAIYKQLDTWFQHNFSDVSHIKQKLRDHFTTEQLSNSELQNIHSAKSARDWMMSAVVKEVLMQEAYRNMLSANDVDPADTTTITRERLLETCIDMQPTVLEHQGGCLAIQKIELVPDGATWGFKLYFDRKLFDELRKMPLTEKGYDEHQQIVHYPINIAEYQRWRLNEALKSNTLHDAQGNPMRIGIIMVYADNDERILPPQDTKVSLEDD